MTDTDAGTVTQSSRVQGTQKMWLERLGCDAVTYTGTHLRNKGRVYRQVSAELRA